jgi:hypothetical protein
MEAAINHEATEKSARLYKLSSNVGMIKIDKLNHSQLTQLHQA